MTMNVNKNDDNKENILFSNIKSSRPAVARSLNFTPLRLNLLQKEILEAVNEPLSTVEDVLESDDDKDEETQSSHKKVNTPISNKENSQERYSNEKKSSELNSTSTTDEIRYLFAGKIKTVYLNDEKEKYSSRSVKDPISNHNDSKEIITSVADKLHTEQVENKSPERSNNKKILSTIKENVQTTAPRIQCSIDMGSLLKTPLNNLKPIKSSLSTGKFATPIKFNGTMSGHYNGDLIKIDKVFGSVKKRTNLEDVAQLLKYTPQRQEKPINTIPNNGHFSFNTITVNNKMYIILKELGRGGSSVVYFCFDPVTKEERALKKVFLSKSEPSAVEYINEVGILKKLQKCSRIIRMYDSELQEYSNEGKLLWVVLEKGGLDLGKILKKVSGQGNPLANHVIMFYWMEMLYAVKQIHENGIIHSDLKPANFIKAESSLKLIDFGIASCIQNDMTSVIKNVAVGSFEYISPEALLNDNSRHSVDSPNCGKPKFKISFRSDVWSLGCILYQLLFGRTPFQHIGNISAKLSTIMDPKHKIAFPVGENVPEKFIVAVKQCLQYNVKQRPSVDELIKSFEC